MNTVALTLRCPCGQDFDDVYNMDGTGLVGVTARCCPYCSSHRPLTLRDRGGLQIQWASRECVVHDTVANKHYKITMAPDGDLLGTSIEPTEKVVVAPGLLTLFRTWQREKAATPNGSQELLEATRALLHALLPSSKGMSGVFLAPDGWVFWCNGLVLYCREAVKLED
jgi:hypothetical protein